MDLHLEAIDEKQMFRYNMKNKATETKNENNKTIQHQL